MDEEEQELCQNCKKNPACILSTCPYKEDIHDDYETLCNCYDKCQTECRMDI